MPTGYKSIDTSLKNKHAEVMYRDAIKALYENLFGNLLKELKKSYTNVRVNNAVGETQDIFEQYRKFIQSPKFQEKTGRIVVKWYNTLKKMGHGQFRDVMRKALGIKFDIKYGSRPYDQLFRLAIQQNVSLITNMANQTLNNIQSIVYNGMTSGQDMPDLNKQLQNQFDMSAERAKLIARDQSAKAHASLNELEMQDAGIEFFEWDTAGDSRVSTGKGGHKQLDGKIYRMDDPDHLPVIDADGNRGMPGDRVNCRCTAKAVILMDDYKAIRNSDGSYRIVRGRA